MGTAGNPPRVVSNDAGTVTGIQFGWASRERAAGRGVRPWGVEVQSGAMWRRNEPSAGAWCTRSDQTGADPREVGRTSGGHAADSVPFEFCEP